MTLDTLFPREFVQALLGLLAAVAIDLVLGVSVAIKNRTFDWKKIANFYTSSVIPYLLGWGVSDVVLRLAGGFDIPIVVQLIPIGIGGLYALALTGLLGSIVSKMTILRADAPAPAPAVTVTMTLPTTSAPTPVVTTSASGTRVTDESGKSLPVTPALKS